jgi:hypothetical protein
MTMNARQVAYTMVALGCLWAALTAVLPHAPGAYRLAWGPLFWGLMPYYVLLMLTGILQGTPLVASGASVLGVDLLVRSVFPPGTGAADVVIWYLPLVLVVIVLPAGWALGRWLQRRGAEDTG